MLDVAFLWEQKGEILISDTFQLCDLWLQSGQLGLQWS